MTESGTTSEIERLRQAGDNRRDVLAALFEEHRARLLRMVRMRMHPGIRPRVDPTDVLQEASLEVDQRLDEYLADPRLPFFLWLRLITAQQLMRSHRVHLGAKRRDARREASPAREYPDATTFAMAERFAAAETSPSMGVVRQEAHDRLLEQIEQLSDTDRNVISMRHFEGMTNEEVASELGLGKHAASKRYIRALGRLRTQIGDLTF